MKTPISSVGFFSTESLKSSFNQYFKTVTSISLVDKLSFEERLAILSNMMSSIEKSDETAFVQEALYKMMSLFQHHKVPFNKGIYNRLETAFIKYQQSLDAIDLQEALDPQMKALYHENFFKHLHATNPERIQELVDLSDKLAASQAPRRAHDMLNMVLTFSLPDQIAPQLKRKIVIAMGQHAESTRDKALITETAKRQIHLMKSLQIPYDLEIEGAARAKLS